MSGFFIQNRNDTVLYHSGDTTGWQFLYDFGARPGDVWTVRAPDFWHYDWVQVYDVVDTGTTFKYGSPLRYIVLQGRLNTNTNNPIYGNSPLYFGYDLDLVPAMLQWADGTPSVIIEKIGGVRSMFPISPVDVLDGDDLCDSYCGITCYGEHESGLIIGDIKSDIWYPAGQFDFETLLTQPEPEQHLQFVFKQSSDQQHITLELEDIRQEMDIQIIDVLGRVVYQSHTREQTTTISTSGWAPGVYVLQAGGEGGVFSRKFVVE